MHIGVTSPHSGDQPSLCLQLKMYPELLLVLLVMLASPGEAAVEDGAARHQSQHYNNVFFSDPPHMKGRPSTSFVMVSSNVYSSDFIFGMYVVFFLVEAWYY